MKGSIRLLIGFLMMFGAVGGMENPDQAEYFLEQLAFAVLGLALMMWAVRDINRQADQTIDNIRDWR
jgi:cell division protein FtsW (lipid II flippase)